MSIKEIVAGGGIALVTLMSLIQVSKINVNPWSWVGKMMGRGLKLFGRLINTDVLDKVSALEKKVSDLQNEVADVQTKMDEMSSSSGEESAISARARILRFGDEVLHGIKHTKDHYDSVLRDAKKYSRYCDAHPEFENGVTEPTIERIKAVYAECLEKNDFL